MYAHTEPPTRTFLDVSDKAFRALVEASKLTQDTWSVTINRALAADGMIATAYRNGGMFSIQQKEHSEEFIEPTYEPLGKPRTAITTVMSTKGLRGLAAGKPRPPTYKWQTVSLNRALQRWYDIVTAHHEHRLLAMQHHRYAPKTIVTFF
jgi:hypothetical protein